MRAALAALAAGVIAASPALAQGDAAPAFTLRTAADLVRVCSADPARPQGAGEVGFCHGYGAGAVDYHRAITPAGAAPLFCAPSPAPSFEAMRARYVAWVNADAARGSLRAIDSVFVFLRDTFPCPAQPATARRR